MSRSPFVWITESPDRGLALIRAVDKEDLPVEARWSTAGSGYVIPLHRVPDFCAHLEIKGHKYRVRQVAD